MRNPYPSLATVPHPHLLASPDLGLIRPHNRVVVGSVHTGLEDRLWDLGKLAAYYRERARDGVGLIVTDGFAPCREGWLPFFGSNLTNALEMPAHRRLIWAVHVEGGKILLQTPHAGRHSYHPMIVSASPLRSPISWFTLRELSERGIRKTTRAFVRYARLAKAAAYDGVEMMDSESCLLNQFFCSCTNRHDDQWDGPLENRMRLMLEIVRDIRRIVDERFIFRYHLSLLDPVEGGNAWDEVRRIALVLEEIDITPLDTGIDWHEPRVSTVITSVPRAASAETSTRLRYELKAPVIASNRISTPEVAESLLATGKAGLISMARPLLADPQFVAKAGVGRAEEINTCIACSQTHLDHAFANRRAICLVNPRAVFETELHYRKVRTQRCVAVIGVGPAGFSAACTATKRGHRVSLFEAGGEIGGQFNLAKRIPDKEKFRETLRYFRARLERLGVDLRLGHWVCQGELDGQFDDVVVATGVRPHRPRTDDIGGLAVLSYVDVLCGTPVDAQVVTVGVDGIGFDVAAFLIATPSGGQPRVLGEWLAGWGVDLDNSQSDSLRESTSTQPVHQVWLLQHKLGAPGT